MREVTGGYKGFRRVTRGYRLGLERGKKGVTEEYKGLEKVTRGYRGLQGFTEG